MYSKIYRITCKPGQSDAMLAHYDAEVVPEIKASELHIGHQMAQTAPEEWALISNYVSESAAIEAQQMVQDIIAPMVEKFGIKLELVTQGDVIRNF
ncbi:MAG: hypothetical protein DWQ08_09170 [Proteobacteria bacterium]|nr:MAG: hypothetical protein DWQ08_09170 [Pseudomonadota bacterium]